MTRYEQGFLTKCAEHGVDPSVLFEKIAEQGDSGNSLKNVGRALMLSGMAVPAFFLTRGGLRLNKALRLIRSGALKTTGEVDRAIASHLAKVNKTLPKYKWSTMDDIRRSGKIGIGRMTSDAEVIAENAANARRNSVPGALFKWDDHLPLTSSRTIPVYSGDDVVSAFNMRSKESKLSPIQKLVMYFQKKSLNGGHFNPDYGYISMGKGNHLHPKMLMHELGHAKDLAEGKLVEANRKVMPKSVREWWNLIRNPDSSELLQSEIRAWDNAGIRAGDELREAALGTYRNGVQGQMMAPIGSVITGAGATAYGIGRRKSRKNG